MFRSKLMFVAMLALAASPIGCGGDDDDDGSNQAGSGGTGASGGSGGSAGSEQMASTISGTVTYDGDKEGPLVVSIHSDFPPSMTNVMGFAQVAEPEFPATYTIENVYPGTYYVVAYISVGMFHPGAGPGDPQGAYVGEDLMPATVDVGEDAVSDVDIALMDTD